MNFDAEFKKAIQSLPSTEKDKLILRLLRRDLPLANRLRFELIELETVEDKRSKLEEEIINKIQNFSDNYYSAGHLLMWVRGLSGEINEHVFVTKDKLGEISLNCKMLLQLLKLNNHRLTGATKDKTYSLCIYIMNRIFKVLILIQKQHEDFHIEFSDDLEQIGKLIGSNSHLMKIAIMNGLDVNWLIQFDLPKDVAGIHKNIRDNGFLR